MCVPLRRFLVDGNFSSKLPVDWIFAFVSSSMSVCTLLGHMAMTWYPILRFLCFALYFLAVTGFNVVFLCVCALVEQRQRIRARSKSKSESETNNVKL